MNVKNDQLKKIVIIDVFCASGKLPFSSHNQSCCLIPCQLILAGDPTSVEDVDLLILSSQWAGVACIRQVHI